MRICETEKALDAAADQIRKVIKDIAKQKPKAVQDGSSDLSIIEGNSLWLTESWIRVTESPWDVELPHEATKAGHFIRYKALVDWTDGLFIFLLIECHGELIDGEIELEEGYSCRFTETDRETRVRKRTGIEDASIDPPSNRRGATAATSMELLKMPMCSYEDRIKLRLCNPTVGLDAYVNVPNNEVERIVRFARDNYYEVSRRIKDKPLSPPPWRTSGVEHRNTPSHKDGMTQTLDQ